MSRTSIDYDADVIVVGAGPAGATTAYHLARTGLDVLLLEKTAFPREKVCGDGLTPRAVKQLVKMGIDTSTEAGWLRNHGLRIYGGGMRLELPWPDLAEFPSYGLVRKRTDFDEVLARQAEKAGVRLHERTAVTGPVHDERTGRIIGVTVKPAKAHDPKAGKAAAKAQPDDAAEARPDEITYRAPLVIAADGNSSRLSVAVGLRRREDRPMGVAVRTYFTSPRHDDDWLESWLELWDGKPGQSNLLPGYGWVFGMGDGTSNVGLGLLNTSTGFQNADYRALLKAWLSGMPEEWGFVDDHQVGPVRGAALPMGFNRQPHYARGLMLVGDAGGMVNPFNGEGIAYAMESGELAADIVAQALARPAGSSRERVLASYPRALKDRYGGYYTLGRLFVKAIGNPQIMKLATRHGLPHPVLMRFTIKLLANLTDPRGGDAMDRVINAMCKVTPAA
ncbi:geranylgeranyl reductase family protein [Actinopolymorpha alba]|uniref:geranylgeranyl reductase family protein n=1 Tax=Actinopolymorpha alba TaxID=533267 RepID=UPI00036A3395|nr:geranylgeranyl reductase family protein [Actinopolymorpha alba]